MSLKGLNVLVTGASMGIGAACSRELVCRAANVILFARSEDKLSELSQELKDLASDPDIKIRTAAVDVRSYESVKEEVISAVKDVGEIDVLINNAGLALGAPARFHELKVEDIDTMNGTNVSGVMYTTHAVLNEGGMAERKRGTILNVTSTTGLEVPPFPGEAVYHASKAMQEAFTNVLRAELVDTNIKVIALRPGVVATHFHEQRVNYDKGMYEDFMSGFDPLASEDVAKAAMYMLEQRERVTIGALTVQPTAQRILPVVDKNWTKRQQELGIKE